MERIRLAGKVRQILEGYGRPRSSASSYVYTQLFIGSMIVRPYRPDEAASLARLFTDAVRAIGMLDYCPEQIAAWAPEPPDLCHWRARLAQLTVLIGEYDSEIAGFVTFEIDGHLVHLYVHKDFQRKGIASELCRRFEKDAASRGLRRVYTEASITARPFFECAGYRVIGAQTVQLGAVALTNFRMEKFLKSVPGNS